MKRLALFATVAAFGFLAIVWFAGSAPASNKPLGQINVQELTKAAPALVDTTPAEPI